MKKGFVINFRGVDIPFVTDFEKGNTVMINANKMAQCFPGKRLDHFLENQSTQDYINALSRNIGIPIFDLVVTRKGNSPRSGTWMYEDLAIEFARWLNPNFGVWCNRKIRELIINQTATIENDNIQIKQVCDNMRPYANYGYDLMENSKITFSTEGILKDVSCNMSIDEVYAKLVSDGYVGRYKDHNTWFLKAPYGKRDYTKLVSKVIYKNGKPDHTVNQVKWTEAGRWFLISILLEWKAIQSVGAVNP